MRAHPALLLALALAVACKGDKDVTYRTEKVTRGPVAEVVSATGGVEALVTVNVGSQVSGTIARRYVDFNSPVKKDQVIAEIDPRLFQAALERAAAGLAAAEAEVVKAQAALADAQRTEKRAVELSKRALIAQADVDSSVAAREGAAAGLMAARARVMQARAERDQAQTNVQLCKIRSPIDGIVISRSIDVGQTVAASLQAPQLFLIANDLTRMQILANIDEADVGKVKEGLTARFTVDAYPGEVFEGRIREVRQAPTTIQNVVTYAAVVEAPNPERKLRQGMTASVTVVTNRREDAVRVPNAALRYRPAGEGGGRGGGGGGGGAPGRGGATPGVARADPGERRGPPAEGGERPASTAQAGERHGDAERSSGAERAAGTDRGERGEAGDRKGARRGRAFKLVDGKPAGVDVQLGLSDGRQTEVVAGLAEGDEVIVGDSGSGGPGGPQGGPRRGLF
jgi:HlyD family secretion protein